MEATVNTSIDQYLREIVERLKPLNPWKIFLFGSHATGTPGEDSDIDLYIILNEDFMPASYEEKIDLKVKAARAIRNVRKHIPIDLVVHTLPMYREFIKSGSFFVKEIIEHGSLLYESSN